MSAFLYYGETEKHQWVKGCVIFVWFPSQCTSLHDFFASKSLTAMLKCSVIMRTYSQQNFICTQCNCNYIHWFLTFTLSNLIQLVELDWWLSCFCELWMVYCNFSEWPVGEIIEGSNCKFQRQTSILIQSKSTVCEQLFIKWFFSAVTVSKVDAVFDCTNSDHSALKRSWRYPLQNSSCLDMSIFYYGILAY